MISRLSPFFQDKGNALPSSLRASREQIVHYWDQWMLWRMIGKRVEAFVIATGWQGPLPKAMLEVFFELDGFYDKMESQWLEKLAKQKQRGKG